MLSSRSRSIEGNFKEEITSFFLVPLFKGSVRMKIRGWMLAALVVLSAQCAMAASSTADIAAGGDDVAVANIVAATGMDEAVVKTQLRPYQNR